MKNDELISRIETDYDVSSIKFKDISLWLELRTHVYNKITSGESTPLKITSQTYFVILRSFFYGFFNWFRKYDAWLFNTDIDRVDINGKYFDKYFDYPASKIEKSLVIELPSEQHFKRNKVASKYIVSRSVLIIIEKFYGIFINTKKAKLEIYHEISKAYNVEVDTNYVIKKMVSQYNVMSFVLKFRKPKIVFLAPSYTAYGYIKALKEKGVTVVEIQHGIIQKEHFGYNIQADFNREYFVDYLLTFGSRESKVFLNGKGINHENVIPVGHFYLNQIKQSTILNSKLKLLKQSFLKTVSVSLQDVESSEKMIANLVNLASKRKDILFLMKPRRTKKEVYLNKYSIPKNMKFMDDIDVYEIILHSDFHLTVYSTCALEAPTLGIKNILFDIDGQATRYFGEILNDRNTTFFVKEANEIESILDQEIYNSNAVIKANRKVFYDNYTTNMDAFLNKIYEV